MYLDSIKEWDEHHCEKHVGNLVCDISALFLRNKIDSISYIDIGANVGKVYDLLSKKLNVMNVWMYEASPILSEYVRIKYSSDPKVFFRNAAVCNRDEPVSFFEGSIDHQIQHNSQNLNLGLCKIDTRGGSCKVDAIKLSDIIRNTPTIRTDVNFIKIDTETVDLEILQDLIDVIDFFTNKPVIEFEINYHSIITKDSAQSILDKYTNYGYNRIDLSITSGDGILIPNNLKNG